MRGQLSDLALVTALLLLVVFVNPPTHTVFMYVLHKSAHPAVFAWAALIYLRLTSERSGALRWKSYFAAFGIALVSGVATEFAQSFLNRNPSAGDVLLDAIGAIASLATAALAQGWTLMRPSPRACVVLLASVASFVAITPLVWCVAAYANRDIRFPTVLQYRSPLDLYFVKVWTGDAPGVELPTEWVIRRNEKAVEFSLERWKPGIRLFETYPDWRGYDAASLEVTNPNPTQVDLTVRIDAESPDYCDVPFKLEPRTRSTLRIQLDEIGPVRRCRELNKNSVAGMAIFAPRTTPGGKLYVNRIWLD